MSFSVSIYPANNKQNYIPVGKGQSWERDIITLATLLSSGKMLETLSVYVCATYISMLINMVYFFNPYSVYMIS